MDEANILTALVATDQGLLTMDVIYHECEYWLVPEWLDTPTEGWTMPARVVRLASLQHQRLEGQGQAHFVVNAPIPISVLRGDASPEEAAQWQVVERPNIQIAHREH